MSVEANMGHMPIRAREGRWVVDAKSLEFAQRAGRVERGPLSPFNCVG